MAKLMVITQRVIGLSNWINVLKFLEITELLQNTITISTFHIIIMLDYPTNEI